VAWVVAAYRELGKDKAHPEDKTRAGALGVDFGPGLDRRQARQRLLQCRSSGGILRAFGVKPEMDAPTKAALQQPTPQSALCGQLHPIFL